MKDMKVVVKILTYPLLSEEPPKSTMFVVMKISPLIQQHHAAQVPAVTSPTVTSHTCMMLINIQFL